MTALEQTKLLAELIDNQPMPEAWCEQHDVSLEMLAAFTSKLTAETVALIFVESPTAAIASALAAAFSLGHDFALARMGERVSA